MKNRIAWFLVAVLSVATLGNFDSAFATPSTTYWTPATSDIQPFGVYHLGIDNYFTVARKNDKGALPTDLGLTVGVLPFDKLQMEVGVDWMEPTNNALMFNAKIGTPEGKLFNNSPALNVGIFNAGTDSRDPSIDGDSRTDFNIVDIIIGKTLPFDLGRLHAGVYHGNSKTLVNVNKQGKKDNNGYMIGWDKGLKPTKDKEGNEYSKVLLAADWASGNNAIGGGGFGAYYFFNKDISLLTGPVWFNEPSSASPNANAKWVWTTQLDINF